MWEAPLAATAAELELWTGNADAALEEVTQSLAAMEEAEWPFYSAPLYACAAWAHAERAARARVLRRDDDAGGARAAADALVERLDARAAANLATIPPEYRAWRAQITAELSRIDGPGDAEAWRDARGLWDEIHFPLPSGYCAWREAEALLAADDADRTAVRELLVAAHAAVDAEARPLRQEIEGLARRARIDLTEAPEPETDLEAAPTAAESVGLTPREAEVLALVAQGHTNRQVAEMLFISEKTASVHVSRILAKLDAANRGEAAVIARQLGIHA
jgi:DNA-binding CsgD family transcriptional regulator